MVPSLLVCLALFDWTILEHNLFGIQDLEKFCIGRIPTGKYGTHPWFTKVKILHVLYTYSCQVILSPDVL